MALLDPIIITLPPQIRCWVVGEEEGVCGGLDSQ